MVAKKLPADSAGFPWEGRTFEHHGTAFADDDGTAPEIVVTALAKIRSINEKLQNMTSGTELAGLLEDLANSHAEAVIACSKSRMLIPLIAEAGDYGLTDEGKIVEKTQELSIVTVAAPDGRKVMPVFTSVAAMQRWNATARPIPVPGVQVAVAAAQEETDLVIVDPGSPETEFGVRRPQLEAFALGQHRLPSWAEAATIAVFEELCAGIAGVSSVTLAPGDPYAKLAGPETIAAVSLLPGLDESQVREIAGLLQNAIGQSETIAQNVDSLAIKFV